jgi:hypothetical protein
MQTKINNDLEILDQWGKTWFVDFNTRGRSSSRKRPLSGNDEQMKPPSSRQRSQSVIRKAPIYGSEEQVTFKTQGQSFNMCKYLHQDKKASGHVFGFWYRSDSVVFCFVFLFISY